MIQHAGGGPRVNVSTPDHGQRDARSVCMLVARYGPCAAMTVLTYEPAAGRKPGGVGLYRELAGGRESHAARTDLYSVRKAREVSSDSDKSLVSPVTVGLWVPNTLRANAEDSPVVLSFDTSAIDQLERETVQDRMALVAGLRTLGRIQITGLNVSESLSIVGAHRTQRLRFLGELTGEYKPLQMPNELLAEIARAYQERRDTVVLGDDVCWTAVKNPAVVNDHMAAIGGKWHRDRELWFFESYHELRISYTPLFKKYRDERPRSASAMIRYFIERAPTYWDALLIPIYERQTGNRPSHAEFQEFLKRVPAWRMFWLARVYALYRRAVGLRNYGKRNAGLNDLDSAIYVPFCDTFITNDARQRRALKVINAANPRRTRVLSYAAMRSRLLGF